MKKMVVLTMVLGMAVWANAGLSLVTDWSGTPLNIGDTITINVFADSVGIDEYAYLVVSVDNVDMGTVSGGDVNLGNLSSAFGGTIIDYFPLQENQSGVDFYLGDSGGAILDGIAISGITFQCKGKESVVVELWASPDFANFSQLDRIEIFQVPEPASMLLLGLGGLLLRRK